MQRIITTLFLALLFPVLVVFFFANRQQVTISFDPTNLEQPALAMPVPLYVGLSGALFLGFLLGAMGMWISTTRLRQRVGDAKRRVRELEHEVKMARERQPIEPRRTALPAIRS